MQVDGRVVFITGAASGIGAAMARAFAAAGAAKVVVADVDARGAEAVAASIDGMPIALDVTDEQATIDAVASVTASHGGIDILCLNAGIAIAGSVDAPDEDWQRIWDVNIDDDYHEEKAA